MRLNANVFYLIACLVAVSFTGCTDATTGGAGHSAGRGPDGNALDGEVMLADDKPGVMHAGTTMVVAFHLSGDGRAAYVLTGRDESRMDICLIEASERGFWEQGMKTRGYACHDDVNMARDSASLPEGNYYLALRCENVFADCDFSYSLKLHG